MTRPRIGISANIFPPEDRPLYKGKPLLVVEGSLVGAVVAAGGVPIGLPVVADPEVARAQADLLDGLLLSGGVDVDPTTYGQARDRWPGQPERDAFEALLYERLRTTGRPVLGVCRGHQMLNVANGGTLLQDIQTARPECHVHRSQEHYDTLRHPARVEAGTLLADTFGGAVHVDVNSVHHQAVDQLGDGVVPVAWSDDGLVEGLTVPSDPWTWGVQWHPEWDPRRPHRSLFVRFVAAARAPR